LKRPLVSTQPKTFLTPEQYLEIERKAESKSEYYRGEMFAMAGARIAHNLLLAHLLRDIGVQLRGTPCEICPSDMRVLVSASGLYTYPDAVAYCGEPRLLDQHFDTLLNPILLIEVLSPSTEAYDRGRKFEHYRSIDSLREYLMIASDRVHADLFTRQSDDRWLLTSATRLENSLELQSIGCSLNLGSLYKKVSFAEPGAASPGMIP
jgi:Uma2 family endonuclease